MIPPSWILVMIMIGVPASVGLGTNNLLLNEHANPCEDVKGHPDLWIKKGYAVTVGSYYIMWLGISMAGFWHPSKGQVQQRRTAASYLRKRFPKLGGVLNTLKALNKILTEETTNEWWVRAVIYVLGSGGALVNMMSMLFLEPRLASKVPPNYHDTVANITTNGNDGHETSPTVWNELWATYGTKDSALNAYWVCVILFSGMICFIYIVVSCKFLMLCSRRHYISNWIWMKLLDHIVQPVKALHMVAFDSETQKVWSLYDVKLDLDKPDDLCSYVELREYVLSQEMLMHYKATSKTVTIGLLIMSLCLTYSVTLTFVYGVRDTMFTFAGVMNIFNICFLVVTLFIILSTIASIYALQRNQVQHLNKLQINSRTVTSAKDARERNRLLTKIQAHLMDDDKYAPRLFGLTVKPSMFYAFAGYVASLVAIVVSRLVFGSD